MSLKIEEDSIVFKVLVLGDQGVGKTTLIKKYTEGTFITETKSTIGVDFSLKTVTDVDNQNKQKKFVLQIWDFAGDSKFRSILPNYTTGAEAVILCFDATNPLIDNLDSWINVVLDSTERKDLLFILISTKNDLKKYSNPERIKSFREKYPEIIGYLPTSSRTGANVESLFQLIRSKLIKKYGLL
ncbi:MAG: Rab family GTPase [Candidatus Hodarchaeales archaeon]